MAGPDPAVVSLVAAMLVSAFTVGGTWWFGRRAQGYSHRRATISELGAAGTKDARAVAWLWFAPSGLLFVVAATALGEALGTDDARRAAFPLALLGVGWIGAAIFPCDPGAPAFGTVRNQLHNLAGGGAYLAGAAGLFELGGAVEHSLPFVALLARGAGAVVVLGLFLVSLEDVPIRGLIQRLMEALLHGWLLLAAAAAVLYS